MKRRSHGEGVGDALVALGWLFVVAVVLVSLMFAIERFRQ